MKELMQNFFELQSVEFKDTTPPKIEKRIAELRAKIPIPVLNHYDRLRVRGKKGVALVQHQSCMGCHMQVPLGVIVDLKRNEDVRLCEHCGRYLYLREDASPEAEHAPI